MKKKQTVISITRASSRGQIVVPRDLRKKLSMKSGSLFMIAELNDMIVLKKLENEITKSDMNTLKLVEEAWKDMEHGRYKIYSKGEFFKEFSKW